MIGVCEGEIPNTIEGDSESDVACQYAIKYAGCDCDEFCTDPFTFSVNGIEFVADPQKSRRVIVCMERTGERWLCSPDGTVRHLDNINR